MDELYRTQVKSVPMFNGMQVPAALRIFILNLVDALAPVPSVWIVPYS
jgi:hypothetical protein